MGEEWVASEKWKKDRAHDGKILKCYSLAQHKVGRAQGV